MSATSLRLPVTALLRGPLPVQRWAEPNRTPKSLLATGNASAAGLHDQLSFVFLLVGVLVLKCIPKWWNERRLEAWQKASMFDGG